jgi:hypothetical protein
MNRLFCFTLLVGSSFPIVVRDDEEVPGELCTCNSDSNTQYPHKYARTPICEESIDKISKSTFERIEKMSSSWNWKGLECKRPEAGFRQSLLQQSDPRQLVKFMNKLDECNEKNDPVSVVILGGSVTRGSGCGGGEISKYTETLNLPHNLSLNIEYGNDDCPWANKFHALLRDSHPKCKYIDVYNLAFKSTNQLWVSSILFCGEKHYNFI